MKRLYYVMNGMAALTLILLFSQCAGKSNQEATTSAQPATLSGMKIAYVEIDTLLSKYNFFKDLSEEMVKKSENVRLTLNQKANDQRISFARAGTAGIQSHPETGTGPSGTE